MKKCLVLFTLLIMLYLFLADVLATKNLIPNDAIRVRVIANSNSEYDQYIKNEVKEELESNLSSLLKNDTTIISARNTIISNLNNIEKSIQEKLYSNKYNNSFDLNYGLNFFPQKRFRGIEYKEGYYESLVVTLGEGLGDNWWCVLFPPICLIEAEESSDVEYSSLISEIINKYS